MHDHNGGRTRDVISHRSPSPWSIASIGSSGSIGTIGGAGRLGRWQIAVAVGAIAVAIAGAANCYALRHESRPQC